MNNYNNSEAALQKTLVEENHNKVAYWDTSEWFSHEAVLQKILQAEDINEFSEIFDEIHQVCIRRISSYFETFRSVMDDALFADKKRNVAKARRKMIKAACDKLARSLSRDVDDDLTTESVENEDETRPPNLHPVKKKTKWDQVLHDDAKLIAALGEKIMEKITANAQDSKLSTACFPSVCLHTLKENFGTPRIQQILRYSLPILKAVCIIRDKKSWYSDRLHTNEILYDFLCATNQEGGTVPKKLDELALVLQFLDPENYTDEEQFWLFDPVPSETREDKN